MQASEIRIGAEYVHKVRHFDNPFLDRFYWNVSPCGALIMQIEDKPTPSGNHFCFVRYRHHKTGKLDSVVYRCNCKDLFRTLAEATANPPTRKNTQEETNAFFRGIPS